MVQTLILADDLSGAADSAIACAAAGTEPVVLLDPNTDPSGASVIAVDVNSRSMAPAEAGPAAAAVVEKLFVPDTSILYQKMDSTLRGNWAIELAHVLSMANKVLGEMPLAIIAPAFPGTGRTTRHGRVLVNSVPLEETETWKHEGLIGAADLPVRLAEVGLAAELAGLDQVRRGADVLRAQLMSWVQAGTKVVVCDAEVEADLLVVAAASLSLSHPRIWVGSGGLMRALIQAQGFGSGAPAQSMRISVTRPVLTIVGSASRVSHDQFDELARQPGITALILAPEALRNRSGTDEKRRVGRALDAALSLGSDVALTIDHRANVDLHEGAQFAASLAALVAPRLPKVGGLVVTGGETARAILVRYGISGLRLQGELEPGVPVGMSIGKTEIPVVTKAGAFGSSSTLVRCRAALHGDGISDRP